MDKFTIAELIDHCDRQMKQYHLIPDHVLYREHEAVKGYLQELHGYRQLKKMVIKVSEQEGYPTLGYDTASGWCKCGRRVVNITPRSKEITFCPDCGQALIWER